MSTMEKTAGRLVRSAGAATLSQVWRIGVTFLTHMALRRLIPPEELGVWVWAEPLFLIVAQIRDLGLPGHIVRERSRPYGNFLGIQLGWGGLLSALLFLAAPIVVLAYRDHSPEVIAIVRVLSLFLFIQGLGAVPMVYFEAELAVQKTIPAELVRNVSFALLSIGLAVGGYGVWSVIIGHVVGSALYTAMLWWKAWGQIGLAWVPGMRRLVALSWPLALMSLAEQTVLKLDAFVLGLRFPTEVVGVAGLAMYAVFFFSRILADAVGRALYPALVEYASDPPRLFEAFRVATLFMLALGVPTAFFLLINARPVALFLGGEKWLGATSYLQVFSLVPLVRPFNMFGLELLLTRHQDRLLIVATLINLLALGGLGLYLTTTSLGPLGMAVAGYFPLGSLLLNWGVYRISPRGFRSLVVDVLELYAVAAAVFVPVLWVGEASVWTRIVFSCLAGLVVLGYAFWRWGNSFRRFLAGEPAG